MTEDNFFATGGVDFRITDLSKRYRTAAEEVHALEAIQWEVKAGQAVAIMGPSGCGKTTLLNLLGGVDLPSEGRITVGDQELTALKERALEKYRLFKVGFVFQFFNLIPALTALENVKLPMLVAGTFSAELEKRATGFLTTVGLAHKLYKRPEELSGGEQQRVAVAVALANDPPLILADEPTGNLDSKNAAAIVGLFVSLAKDYGKTVIMATHDPKVVERLDKVWQMRDGRFIAA